MSAWSAIGIGDLSDDFRLDPEHYRAEYLAQQIAMAQLPHDALMAVADVSDGNHLSIAEEFVESGVRYLRGQDLSDFFISDADPVFITERTYNTLVRSQMFPDDVLVGIVGTIGSVGLVTTRHGKLTGNCKLAIVRARKLPAEYIAAYLASRIGQNEIQRRVRGAVQMGLILPDLKSLPIILPSDAQRDSIVTAVKSAQIKREYCRELLQDAERTVSEALGLSSANVSATLFYERDFVDLEGANRFGAEYFMPCKQRLLNALSKQASKLLRHHFLSVREVFYPRLVSQNVDVRNFDITHALEPVLDDRIFPVPAKEIGSAKKRMRSGDVVISRLRSYLREIALVRTSSSIPAVGSSEFVVLRKNKGSSLTPETLFVFLRSVPVQVILEWCQNGSQHPRFSDDDLLNIPVPDALVQVGPSVDALVSKALRAHAESDRLIHSAKILVESLIGEKARSAGQRETMPAH